MLVTKAKWIAYNHINVAKIYTKYVAPEDAVTGKSDETNNEEIINFEIIGFDPSCNPEEILVKKERESAFDQAVSKLPQDASDHLPAQERLQAGRDRQETWRQQISRQPEHHQYFSRPGERQHQYRLKSYLSNLISPANLRGFFLV
jgi:hypothetical protein